MMTNNNILEIRQVSKIYEKENLVAVNKVSFSIKRNQILALIGRSGSGKSTLAKMIMRLEKPSSGEILIDSLGEFKDIFSIEQHKYYQRVQMVFQDPYSSLNPCKKIWQIITAPLCAQRSIHQSECISIAKKYMLSVGLGKEYLDAHPRALSGGQRQRVGIARSLVLNPELLILDEALSALDLSIQAQIVNLLLTLQDKLGLSYLFISHDNDMVAHLADQVVEIK